jgi:acyl-ACP thioesterase
MKKTYKYQVQPQEVDFLKELTFVRLGDCILTTAGKNATENGFGIQQLEKINATWVLSKIAIEVAPLREFQNYAIETWVEEVGRVGTTRNFNILDEQGNTIGGASSAWAMLNLDTRRPVDLQSLEGLQKSAEGGSPPIEKPMRLPDVGSESVSRHTIKYSDIDMNAHVNSVSYIKWLCDLFPKEIYSQKFIRRFELNYIHEALWGERIEIFREERQPDDFFFEMKRGEQTICKARVLWAERK